MDRPECQFLFRLASHLHKGVWELERYMPAVEFREWLAIQDIQPLPDFWYALGRIISVIINVNRTKGQPTRPEDLFPFLKPIKPQDGEITMDEVARWLS